MRGFTEDRPLGDQLRAVNTGALIPTLVVISRGTVLIDLDLNKRVADFEGRLAGSGIGEPIKRSSAAVATFLRRRRRPMTHGQTLPPPPGNAGSGQVQWTDEWRAGDTTEEALARDWKARWQDTRPLRAHGD